MHRTALPQKRDRNSLTHDRFARERARTDSRIHDHRTVLFISIQRDRFHLVSVVLIVTGKSRSSRVFINVDKTRQLTVISVRAFASAIALIDEQLMIDEIKTVSRTWKDRVGLVKS